MRIRLGWIFNIRSLLALAALIGVGYGILGVRAASGSRAQKASCGPTSARTVVADRVARIYRVPTGHGPLGTLYNYYGCTVGIAKWRLLATASALPRVRVYSCVASECVFVRTIRLRGAKVGVIVERHGVDTGSSTLTVRDLAAGHVLHTVAVPYMVPRLLDTLITYVLAPSGNVAWVTEISPDFGAQGTVTIHRVIGHTVSTLDHGPDVRASSLRLRGDTVQWIDGGKPRHASLP